MKIEISENRPEYFKENWPGQYDVFSHFEFACGIPSALFAITTLKENGKPNVSFNAWSSFTGDGSGFYAVIPSMLHRTHTYKNILRTGEFVINFINKDYFDACKATISDNDDETDEFEVGNFTKEQAGTVSCPRIKEAFLCLECKLEKEIALNEKAVSSIMIGRVQHIAAQEEYAKGIDGKYGDDGFMLNIHNPYDLVTGEGKGSAVAVLKVVRRNED